MHDTDSNRQEGKRKERRSQKFVKEYRKTTDGGAEKKPKYQPDRSSRAINGKVLTVNRSREVNALAAPPPPRGRTHPEQQPARWTTIAAGRKCHWNFLPET